MVESYRPLNIDISHEPITTLFANSHLCVVASGTASLEAAIYGIPGIIVYSMSALNYLMGKLLLRVSHIGMANLIAQQRVMPELIQAEASASNIAKVAQGLLSDPAAYAAMQKELIEVRNRLGQAGASGRVADIACEMMGI